MIVNLLQTVLFVAACLLAFTLMYDHCVYGKPVMASLKERLARLLLSPVAFFLFMAAAAVTVLYLVYGLIHNGSLF